MGSSVSKNDLTFSYTDEPHATRRKLILQKYPQVKKLMGVDPSFKWKVLLLATAQLFSFYIIRDITNYWVLFILAYCVGGVANHALMLAIHEISHGAGFGPSRPLENKVLGIIANLPIGFPMSISFKKYHLEHHRYQGDEVLDTDLPSYIEIAFFTSALRKTLWCILQPFFYTIRPLLIHPKPLEKMEMVNIVIQILFDYVIVVSLGWQVLIYAVGGSILAMGLHPVAGHFISEHTLMFDTGESRTRATHRNNVCDSKCTSNNKQERDRLDGSTADTAKDADANGNEKESVNGVDYQPTIDSNGDFLIPETCSYYGPLNWVTFNVGYHVEHHDFPSIPGSRLHLLQKIAPEFYVNLNHHTSWTYVLWRYITDPKIGPFARVRRPYRPGKSQSVN
jgi:sphingolipid delta-4 desaturase